MFNRLWNSIFRCVIVLLGLWLGWDLLAHLVAEILWFDELNYLPVLLKRLQTQGSLWVIVCTASAGFLLGNLHLAKRLKSSVVSPGGLDGVGAGQVHSRRRTQPPVAVPSATPSGRTTQRRVGREAIPHSRGVAGSAVALPLRSLLPIVIVLVTLIGVMLLHYGKIALTLLREELSPLTVTPPLPPPFNASSVQALLFQPWGVQLVQIGVLVVVGIVLIARPLFWLRAIACILSCVWSLTLSAHWSRILQFVQPTAFGFQEPLFGKDISFYVFRLPVWQLLDFWLGGLLLFGLVAAVLIYLVSGGSLSQGKFLGFSQSQIRHLYALGAAVAATTAFHHWLHRYELLYLTTGIVYGAGYTDITIHLPTAIGLSVLAGAIALLLLGRTIFWSKSSRTPLRELSLYLMLVVVINIALPQAVQRLIVQPNELARERPYIQRNIAFTRQAFGLDTIDVQTFDPQGELDLADLQANAQTIRNIRLWDTRPLLETNRQLQQIRLYYTFPDADIDRYTLKQEGEVEEQQVIIAARELDYSAVPQQAKTWVNQHLVYTHGYGFTLSPVNKVGPGGFLTTLLRISARVPVAMTTAPCKPPVKAFAPVFRLGCPGFTTVNSPIPMS